jgi:hypothetical protein
MNAIWNTCGYYFAQCAVSMIRNKIEVCMYGGTSAACIQLNQCSGEVRGFLLSANLSANFNIINIAAGGFTNTITVSGIVANVYGTTSSYNHQVNAYAMTVVNSSQPTILEDLPNFSIGSGATTTPQITDSGATATNTFVQWGAPPVVGMTADIGDNSKTINPLTDPAIQILNSPLTTARTVTLTATNGTATANNSLANSTYTFVRTANSNDSNTWTVLGALPASKVIATGTSSTWQYSRLYGGYVEISASAL